jgi:hypothetical protein
MLRVKSLAAERNDFTGQVAQSVKAPSLPASWWFSPQASACGSVSGGLASAALDLC